MLLSFVYSSVYNCAEQFMNEQACDRRCDQWHAIAYELYYRKVIAKSGEQMVVRRYSLEGV